MVVLMLALLLAAPASSAKAHAKKPAAPTSTAKPPLCDGDYSDAVPAAMAAQVLDGAREQFVFAVRNTATYEHVYYGRDGKLRRSYVRSVIHGTAFSYRVRDGETLLVTNQHVAERPDVTDEEHQVDGVPPGSKKVREQLKIVRSEDDDYEPGHVSLSRVLSDAPADIAILKAHKLLPVMPFRFGRSGALRPGNLVQVRGFPLGAFSAVNAGKVVNPYTEDTEKGWSHADFVVDALLSAGNSGSPVFAVSCRTSEPELVGVFHAGYAEAAALNVVVAIDQLREELETLRVPRREAGLRAEITAQDRDRVVKQLSADRSHALTFPFGSRAVLAQLSDARTLRFAVLDEDFPMVTREALALVDRARSGFGTLDSVVVLIDGAPAEVPAHALEPDLREHFEKLYDALWHQALGVIDYRARLSRGRQSADAFAQAQQARARLRKRIPEQKEQLGLAIFDSDRVGTVAKSAAAVPGAVPPPTAAAASLRKSEDE
ncbi:MAG TPA: serine protease [Myxococcales bacterium]|nr:serine protease [Myxococcales bacterium]